MLLTDVSKIRISDAMASETKSSKGRTRETVWWEIKDRTSRLGELSHSVGEVEKLLVHLRGRRLEIDAQIRDLQAELNEIADCEAAQRESAS